MPRILIAFFILMESCTTQQHAAASGVTVKRVLTYNVLTGFQKDPEQADRFVEWVKGQDADVIAFQELSTFTQDSLERLARRYGHPYAVLNKGNGSPTGITSKYPFTHIEKISGTMHHGCIYVQTGGIHLFATHLNPFSYEKCVEEMKGILMMAAAIPSKEKILITGDLNSFSPQDSTSYPQQRRYGVVQSLLDSGFTDAYRQIHHRFEHSFPTKAYNHKVKSPTRIDYVFVNKTAAKNLTGANIIKDLITDSLSDHYPLLTIFKN
jgi:endonuclease/exonuclease/phosphatase family metal-dependent hydrolase